MSDALTPDHFERFFEALNDGRCPFPWQRRLLKQLAETGWPRLLDLPTGAGKTATLDIAVFHLALEAQRVAERKAPCRIAFVVDRRMIVDEAFERARRIAKALREAKDGILFQVAQRLREHLAEEGADPLVVHRLRGGAPLEPEFVRTPSQPALIVSTVDQVGSRLLFRGYGVSDAAKPIHAGLIGGDCLILLDEAHLAAPFAQTLAAIDRERARRSEQGYPLPPWQVVTLTATPGRTPDARPQSAAEVFALDGEDREEERLRRRLEAPKRARLIELAGVRGLTDEQLRRDRLVEHVEAALKHLEGQGLAAPAIAVVVNRVARARAVFDKLATLPAFKVDGDAPAKADLQLIIGPARPADRADLAGKLAPIKTNLDARHAGLERPLVIVATQTIEAGVDLDLDGLITEAAALDALRQRFGRLDRAGELGEKEITAYAAILAHKDDIGPKANDPVYGKAAARTWEALWPNRDADDRIDFGVAAMGDRIAAFPPEDLAACLTPTRQAPTLMPAYVDVWSATSPVPGPDPREQFLGPSVREFLHGGRQGPEGVRIVWRADLDDRSLATAAEVLELAPPQPGEMLEISLPAARAWLAAAAGRSDPKESDIADAPEDEPDDEERFPGGRRAFRWAGPDSELSKPVVARALRPGDVIVVPATHGGCDAFGWKPNSAEPVRDLADDLQEGRRDGFLAVRVSPALIRAQWTAEDGVAAAAEDVALRLADALAADPDAKGLALRDLVRDVEGLPKAVRARLDQVARRDLVAERSYEVDGRATGVVFRWRRPRGGRPTTPATDTDSLGSRALQSVPLKKHVDDVEKRAKIFAEAAGLPPRLGQDVELAAALHDLGKGDRRFQALLYDGSRWAVDETAVLAKSGGMKSGSAAGEARERAGLPKGWRHEAMSVRLALADPRLAGAHDRELVLWLIGTHHGHGRPFFPPCDQKDEAAPRIAAADGAPIPAPARPGPQSLAFDLDGLDWPALFTRLRHRYGAWELARLETILRLADHRASEAGDAEAGDTGASDTGAGDTEADAKACQGETAS